MTINTEQSVYCGERIIKEIALTVQLIIVSLYICQITGNNAIQLFNLST